MVDSYRLCEGRDQEQPERRDQEQSMARRQEPRLEGSVTTHGLPHYEYLIRQTGMLTFTFLLIVQWLTHTDFVREEIRSSQREEIRNKAWQDARSPVWRAVLQHTDFHIMNT